MKVHLCEQRTPEWFELRRGRITGSEVGKFVYNTGKVAETARQNLIDAKLGEAADGDDCEPSYENYWMKRGTRLEADALSAYESHTGYEVEQVGFVTDDLRPLGVSPDALVNQRAFGLEMKCPSGKIQVKRLREQVCPDEYLPQIWLSMVVTGAPQWHFWSWHPVLPAFHIVVTRDEIPREFEPAVDVLAYELERQKAWLSAL